MFGQDSRYVFPIERSAVINGMYFCQVQSYNSDAIAWGALGKALYATGTRYGVCNFINMIALS